MKHNLKLTFHGGAGTVTGSNFLLENEDKKILVDCGLVQGEAYCNDCNEDPFPYDPKSVDVLIVTHAHIDHIGRIPRLVREGFNGVIYGTPATKELAKISYDDSLKILAYEAEKKGKKPLYEAQDVQKTLSLWETVSYHSPKDIGGDFVFTYKDAGHILGSAMVEIQYHQKNIVFTGDLGNSPSPLLKDTEVIDDADYLIMESVYGDKNHEPKEERTDKLRSVIEKTISQGGVLMIPAFSIERTQVLLYEINNLVEEKKIPSIPVFLDSPFAIKATEVYKRYNKNFKGSIQDEIKSGDDIFDFPQLQFTLTREESKHINNVPAPKIIIAGSGMSHGGRIMHHERKYLSDPKNTLLLAGYQSAGSLGRILQDGAKKVTIFNTTVPVKAGVVTLRSYSAHKDSDNLIEFVSHTAEKVKKVFVVMGETKASLFLVQRLRDYLGVDAIAPQQGESVVLEI